MNILNSTTAKKACRDDFIERRARTGFGAEKRVLMANLWQEENALTHVIIATVASGKVQKERAVISKRIAEITDRLEVITWPAAGLLRVDRTLEPREAVQPKMRRAFSEILYEMQKSDCDVRTFTRKAFEEDYSPPFASAFHFEADAKRALKRLGLEIGFGKHAVCVYRDVNFAPAVTPSRSKGGALLSAKTSITKSKFFK